MKRIGNPNGVAVAIAALLATVTFTPPASAAVSCSQAGTALTVTMTADGDKATFLRGPGREILVNGAQCGTATTENTETVTVTAAAGDQYVYVDLAGGPFVSLQRETSPPSGTSVQFQIFAADWDELYVDGTAAADTIIAGTNGITLDQASPAGELDILLLNGIDTLGLRGRGENDFLSSSGDATTGAPVAESTWVQLHGGEGNDTLIGGDNLSFFPGPGDDSMAGQNTAGLNLYSAPSPVTVDLAAGTATGEGNDSFSGVSGVWGSQFADELTGNGADNVLNGNGGDDVIRGAGGDDWVVGSFGDDDLDGEAGSDTYPDWYVLYETDDDTIADSGVGPGESDMVDFHGSPSPVSVDLAAGMATGVGADTLAGIETVRGTAHADTLLGASGGETLLGMGGDDFLRPGAGSDTSDGGAGVDTLAFDAAPKGVNVSLAAGTAGGEGTDTFTGIERVRGSAFADVLRGSGAANALFGLGGADTLVGGGGADLINGGSGRDTAGYATAPSAVTVDLAKGKAARGAGADTLLGLENVVGSRYADLLLGSPAANVLRGGSGGDTLRGAAGNDRLYGMSASDALYGAVGNDLLSGSRGAHDRCSQGGGAGRRIGCEHR